MKKLIPLQLNVLEQLKAVYLSVLKENLVLLLETTEQVKSLGRQQRNLQYNGYSYFRNNITRQDIIV